MLAAKLARNSTGARRVRIRHRDQPRVSNIPRQVLRMPLAHHAHAGHPYSQFRHMSLERFFW